MLECIAEICERLRTKEVWKVHEAPVGWHWGSKAEVAASMGGGREARRPMEMYYNGNGGWEGFTWGGVERKI